MGALPSVQVIYGTCPAIILLHAKGTGHPRRACGSDSAAPGSGAEQSLGWSLTAATSELSLVLWYPEDAPGCTLQVRMLRLTLLRPSRTSGHGWCLGGLLLLRSAAVPRECKLAVTWEDLLPHNSVLLWKSSNLAGALSHP